MSIYVSPIAVLLSARRRALGLSAASLAGRCSMSPEMIGRLDHGLFLPSPSQAYQMALVLGFDPVELSEWALKDLLRNPELLAEHVLASTA